MDGSPTDCAAMTPTASPGLAMEAINFKFIIFANCLRVILCVCSNSLSERFPCVTFRNSSKSFANFSGKTPKLVNWEYCFSCSKIEVAFRGTSGHDLVFLSMNASSAFEFFFFEELPSNSINADSFCSFNDSTFSSANANSFA